MEELPEVDFMAQDYLMRMVQQIAAMLAAIIAKRRAGKVEEAKQDLASLCVQNVGLTVDTVKQLSPDALATHLDASGALRCSRSVTLAELLIQDAEIHEADGQPQAALSSFVHALCLLSDSFAFLTREEQAIYRPKIESLITTLEQLPSNPYTTQRIRSYRTSTC